MSETSLPSAESSAASQADASADEPDEQIIDTYLLGEEIVLPSATFTVNTIEQRDMIPSSNPDFEPDFVPAEGQRLWYFDITWTNTTNETVDKECHGPYMFDLTAYDINGNEMEMVDQPGFIDGQNCSTALMNGETGRWQSAFYSLDADFGYAVFTDYAGGEAYVVTDPAITLTVS